MLSTTIVPKYFDHSKYQSFCRQLTSYGFYRISDKHEETHCYVHNDTTNDVHSILKIKRRQCGKRQKKQNIKKSTNSSNLSKNINPRPVVEEPQQPMHNETISESRRCKKLCSTTFDSEHFNRFSSKEKNNIVTQNELSNSPEQCPLSLLDIDNLENRVYCNVDKKLMVLGLNQCSEVFNSYCVIPLR